MSSKIFYALIFLMLMAAAGCSNKPMKLQTDGIAQKEGIMIAGTFKDNRKFWFSSGISVKIDQNETIEIPWSESRFINLPAGSHSFEIWYGRFGRRASAAKGCFKINHGQVVYLEYQPQGSMQDGKVEMLDLNNRKRMDFNKSCL